MTAVFFFFLLLSLQAAYELVASGRIEEAVAALEGRYGKKLWADKPHLLFRLKV